MVPAIIIGLIGLATTTVGVVGTQPHKDSCAKDCTEKCKAEHKALFGGRQKCIKACRAEACTPSLQTLPQETGKSEINWWYVLGGGSIILAVIIYFLNRK